MASSRDKNGRPVVVVTGMGVVTSFGAGKADNWAKLTAGESGIRRITRFYVSPGIMSERITLFYAEVDESSRLNDGGGLLDEDEAPSMVGRAPPRQSAGLTDPTGIRSSRGR